MEGAAPKVAVAVFVVVADVETQDSCPALVWLRLYRLVCCKNRHGTLAYGGASSHSPAAGLKKTRMLRH